MGGTRAAAWPLIRHDLALSYTEVGLVLAVPGLVGSALDPVIGVLGDTRRRRWLLVAGGIGFALSTALSSVAVGFWTLLVALVLGNPSVGAFVSLAQATLMDRAPAERERNMARWTLAGSFGYVAGPGVVALALSLGLGWRVPLLALALATLPAAFAARAAVAPSRESGKSLRVSAAAALRTLRRHDVVRWLVVLEGADLLLDVFHGFLALYFVDAVDVTPTTAAAAVAVWTGAGLVGDALLLVLLRRVDGARYVRVSAVAALVAYPAFLLVPNVVVKLAVLAWLGVLNSGWYAIPKARLYASLPGRSGSAIAAAGVAGIVAAFGPLTLGVVASSVGIAATMWILLLAPLVLLWGVRD